MNNRPLTSKFAAQDRNALKIAGLYLLIGSLWILFSDKLILALTRDPVLFSRLSIFKGWGFIVITALVLYWLMRRYSTSISQSEARYRSLFQNNHSVMLLIDPASGKIVDANPSACAFYGYTHAEITRLEITAINQLSPEQIFAEMEQARQEERRQFFFRHRLVNGDIREVEVYSGPIEVQGKALLYSIVHDITERKQVQEALRENEERLRLALAAANQGLYDLNIQTGEVQISPEYATMLGYDPATFHETNAAWIERLHPDDRQSVADNYRAYITDEVPVYAVEFRQRTQGGEWKWILSLGKIVAWDNQGRPLRMLGTHTDIHERKLAEQQLHYQANLLQNVSDAIIATDLDFKITSWNRAAEAIYGWSAAEVMGLSATDLFQVEYNGFQPGQIDQQFQEQGFWQGEVRQKSKSGATLNIMASVSLIRDTQGRPMGVVVVNRDITAYRQAEAQLQRATTELFFLNDLLKHATQPLAVADMQGRFVRLNHAFERLTGYQAEELLQLTYEQLTPESWREIEAQQVAGLLATGQAIRFEKEYRRKDGTVTPIELVVELYRDAQGEPLYTYGFVTDITERKQAEEKLRESEERLAFALEVSQMGSWELNLVDHSAYRSLQHARIFGYEPPLPDWTFEIFLGHIIPADRAEVERTIGQAIAAKSNWSLECRIRRCDGEIRWIWVAGRFRHDVTEDSRQMVGGVVLDITERKRAEKELQDAWDFSKKIFERNPAAITLSKLADRIIVDVNEATEKLLGYTRAELIGKPSTNFDYWVNTEARQQGYEILLKESHLRDYEFAFRTKAGALGQAILYIEIIEQFGEKYFLSIFVDITERKQAEAELYRIMAELKRSNADLEQFAYAASHDLQEPLRGVAGMLTLLQHRYGGQLDERADEFIHHAVEGATRMQTLINDLLILSRVGTRGQPFQPVASADTLADALANLSVAIHESGAAISYDNLPTIVADRTQMTQLFQNLIGNAIKFQGDKAPEIRVKAERQAGEWLFAVTDNGIGLEAKDFERIFGVFQRLYTRREYPGTGIGLALCKKIVERHGGRIWVESQPGQGSTFYFTLP